MPEASASGSWSPLVVAGLVNGDEYTFTVTATNVAGDGPVSATSSSVVPNVALPGVPTGVVASAGDGQASVAFVAPADGGPVVSYTVRATNVSDPAVPEASASGSSSPLVVAGLVNGDEYTFTVTATNVAGDGPVSAASNAVVPNVALPGAPTGVVATAGDGQASVAFVAPADGGPVVSYVVRATNVSDPAVPEASASGSASPLVVAGLTNGDQYTFTVTAVSVAGEGAASLVSNAVVPLPELPGAPTDVVATAGDAQALVSFVAPADGGPVVSYVVRSQNTSDPAELSVSVTGTSSPLVVTGLTNGDEYTFTVVAVNSAGEGPESAPSGVVTPERPLMVPGAPSGVSAVAADAEASITFVAPTSGDPADTYIVTANNLDDPIGGGQSASGAGSPIVVGGLTNGQRYTFSVVAANAAGEGPVSSGSNVVIPIRPLGVPGAPLDVVAEAGNQEATVSFGAPIAGDAAESYFVRATDLANPAAGGPTASGAGSPIVVTGLTNGRDYSFTVIALNAAGEGPASAASNIVTPRPAASSVTVSSVGPNLGTGASWREIYVNGSGFTPGTTVSLGDGITVHQVVLTSPTRLTLKVSIAEDAVIGPRTVAVTAGGSGDAGTCAACYQVLPPPVVSSVAPNRWAPGSTNEVRIGGSFNSWGVTVNVQGSGVTVTSVQATTSLIIATIRVDANATLGPRLMGIRNGDQGITRVPVTIGTALPELPGAPSDVVATPGDGRASVAFTPAATGGLPTSYLVRAIDLIDPAGSQTVSGAASPVVVTGLVNGRNYQFTVTAANAAGESPPSALSAVVTPTAPPASSATVSSVTPGVGPGGSWREVYVNGAGFVPGSTVTISGGVVVNSITSTTPTRITLKVSVAEFLVAGPRNVTVTLPGGGVATCAGCFSVLPPPVITSVSPSSWVPGSTQTIEISGSNFATWGVSVAVNGSGVTVSGVTRVSSTLMRATVVVAPGAALGERSLSVRNGDQGIGRFPVSVVAVPG